MDSTPLTFSEALVLLLSGKRIARSGWNGKGMFLSLQIPDENSKMQQPYIFMSPVDGKLVPWVASHADLLTQDWYEVAPLAPVTETGAGSD